MRKLVPYSIAALSLCLISPSLAATPAQTAPPALPPAAPTGPTQVRIVQPMKVYPLPGGFDQLPMLNSNSPEIVTESGILVSTLAPPDRQSADNAATPFLYYAFNGDFGVFSHHLLHDTQKGGKQLYLGLVATNKTNSPVKLTLTQGASYLSQPDALLKDLPPVVSNPGALVYSGAGSRVATELIAGKPKYKDMEFVVPAQSDLLIANYPVHSDVEFGGPTLWANGRSTLLHFHSNGPLHLTHLAWVADRQGDSVTAPTLEDYQKLIADGKFANKREEATADYAPNDPPRSIKYGRVAGVSEGLRWKGKLWDKTRILERPAPGQKVAYPIASAFQKRFGIQQNQSARMLRRYPDSALEAHANYGTIYELEIPLHNTTAEYQTYSLGISYPAEVKTNGRYNSTADAEMVYLYPPNRPVMYKGSVRLEWTDEYNRRQDQLKHLMLHHGEDSPPLDMITVPPHTNYDIKLSLIYPADATPPELLTIGRIE